MLWLVFGRTNSQSTASLCYSEVCLPFDVNVCAVFLADAKLPL